jgi:hypothetical protein
MDSVSGFVSFVADHDSYRDYRVALQQVKQFRHNRELVWAGST